MQITREMIKINTVFHCDTEKKANELLKKLEVVGCKWISEEGYLINNRYNRYKEDTCYYPYRRSYNDTIFFEADSYDIIEYILDKDSKEFAMKDIKDGYLIETRDSKIYLCCHDFKDRKVFLGVKNSEFIFADNYDLDLIFKSWGSGTRDLSVFDIAKVYDRSPRYAGLLSLEIGNRTLLWERKEEKERMTLEKFFLKLSEMCRENKI